jgi:hypothetical protein
VPSSKKERRCLACGTYSIAPRRRYCSPECRKHLNWVLSLSKGLLRVFNARYAAFSFSDSYIILDVLPIWSRNISRFSQKRTSGKTPAEDLKNLVLEAGVDWYNIIENRNSKSYASLSLLQKNNNKTLDSDAIKPDPRIRPRLSSHERDCMKFLQLQLDALRPEENVSKIKTSYKKLAKIYHPDVGGDEEKFKKLSDAHEQMLLWAEQPQFTARKALVDCWSYDGSTSRWSPPL